MALTLAPDPPPVREELDAEEVDLSGDGAVGYRNGALGRGERGAIEAEAERFAAVAHFYLRLGLPLGLAWRRANEWLEEHPRDLPEGVALETPAAPAPSLAPKAAWFTPIARLSSPWDEARVERLVPREDTVDLEELAEEEPLAVRREVLVSNRDSWVSGTQREIATLLRQRGPLLFGEIKSALGLHPGSLSVQLNVMRHAGLVEHGGRKTPWRLAGQNAPPSEPVPARTPPAAPPAEARSAAGADSGGRETPARAATAPHKEIEMHFTEQVYESLAKAGNATAMELAGKLGADSAKVASALRALLSAQRVNRHGGHKGASWEVGTGKASRAVAAPAPAVAADAPKKTMAAVAKRAAKKVAVASKASGQAGGANGLFAQLAAQLKADHDAAQAKLERKMAALAVLAEDE